MKINVRMNHTKDMKYANVQKKDEQESKHNRKSVNGGSLFQNQGTEQVIAHKRKLAQEKAVRLMSRAWEKDKKSTQEIQNKQEQIAEKTERNAQRSSQLKDLEIQKNALREEYGIEPDSQEQKDLELLEKYQNYRQGSVTEAFSEDEIARLKELQTLPMTEYQKQVLSLNNTANQLKSEMNSDTAAMQGLTDAIREEQINQLGSQDMANAKEAAEAVVEAANQEIAGLLIEEARNHIDETMEESKKQAEEEAEKKEEEEEKLEKAKEKREETEELVQGEMEVEQLELNQHVQRESDRYTKEAQKTIKKMIKQQNLMEEDLKGIEIDFDF